MLTLRRMHSLVSVALAVTGAGCGATQSDPALPDNLPSLAPVSVPGLSTFGPESATPAFSVASNGTIAYTHAFDAGGRRITLMDVDGNIIGRFGRSGEGPGEFGPSIMLDFSPDDILTVTDLAHQYFSTFDLAGNAVGSSVRFGSSGVPLYVDSDSVDIMVVGIATAVLGSVNRISTTSGEGRVIFSAEHPAYSSLDTRVPPVAARGDRVLVVNPYEYEFQEFMMDGTAGPRWGRRLPPRFIVDPDRPAHLPPLPARHLGAIGYDDRGRLWVSVQPDLDSADIFADTMFLGRRKLPCRAINWKFSKRGGWMAILCSAPHNDARVELALYRIVN